MERATIIHNAKHLMNEPADRLFNRGSHQVEETKEQDSEIKKVHFWASLELTIQTQLLQTHKHQYKYSSQYFHSNQE